MRRETQFGPVEIKEPRPHKLCDPIFRELANIKKRELKALLEEKIVPINTLLKDIEEKIENRASVARPVEHLLAKIEDCRRVIAECEERFSDGKNHLQIIKDIFDSKISPYINQLEIS